MFTFILHNFALYNGPLGIVESIVFMSSFQSLMNIWAASQCTWNEINVVRFVYNIDMRKNSNVRWCQTFSLIHHKKNEFRTYCINNWVVINCIQYNSSHYITLTKWVKWTSCLSNLFSKIYIRLKINTTKEYQDLQAERREKEKKKLIRKHGGLEL